MNIFHKTALLTITTLVFFGGANSSSATLARASGEADDGCAVAKTQKELVALRDSTEENERAEEELSLSKKLLGEIISCSSSETERLQLRLNELKELSEEEETLRAEFNERIEAYRTYYAGLQERLAEESELSLDEVKLLARSILEWREQEYSIHTQRIVNFIFLIDGNTIIKIAEARFEKISAALKKIDLFENEKINAILSDAQKNIEEAKALHEDAYAMFLAERTAEESTADENKVTNEEEMAEEEMANEEEVMGEEDGEIVADIQVDTQLEAATSTTPSSRENGDEGEGDENSKANEENTEEHIKSPQDSIRESFDNIKEAYGNFLQISKLVRALLGL